MIIRFSPTETKILDVLGNKTMSIREITRELYKGVSTPPEANNTVAFLIRRINKKAEYHRLSWFINGEGAGRNGRTVWRETIS